MQTQGMELNKQLEEFSRERGADLFGVADLKPVHDLIVSQGGEEIGKFPRAVSLGMRLIDAIVDRENPEESQKDSQYWHHVYNVVTPALNFLAYDVARRLSSQGYKALPVPASSPYSQQKLIGIFSQKLAAHLAGLGWIGKSCLLLTKEFGPRVRLVTVLTDAPLEAGSAMDRPCGKCRVCVDACPVSAFTGTDFNPAEGREKRFDVFKCSEYRKTHACGTCVAVCPMGKKGVRK